MRRMKMHVDLLSGDRPLDEIISLTYIARSDPDMGLRYTVRRPEALNASPYDYDGKRIIVRGPLLEGLEADGCPGPRSWSREGRFKRDRRK